jgi:murein DD-endopeptidase MepM/ murein hydrolase activator NlpD
MCPTSRRSTPGAKGSGIVSFDVILRGTRPATFIVLVACVQLASARSQGHRPLKVSVAPSTLHPGDVARVDVEGANKDEHLTATAFGQDLAFHYDERQQKWHALAGIDLDTKPGAYRLRIQRNGSADPSTQTLRILAKAFRVRRLNVPANFVEPPPEALEQIARDSRTLAAAYARVSARKWTGPFVLPVDGEPTSNFGTRSYYNGQPRSPHAGVDFVGKTGTPIRAANRGEVVVAAPMYFTGNTIVVDYGDRLFSVFAHLSELHVKAGDMVEPTTIVGLVGATGRVTGPHLHWSVRLSGARVDPLSLVAASADAERVNDKR